MIYAEALERQVEVLRWSQRRENLFAKQGARSDGTSPMLRALSEGDTYYWHPELMPVLEAGATSLPDAARLDMTALPSPMGWCWFGAPLPIPGRIAADLGLFRMTDQYDRVAACRAGKCSRCPGHRTRCG